MSINSSQTTAPVAKIAPTQDLRARTQPQESEVAATRSEKGDNTNVTLSELTKNSDRRQQRRGPRPRRRTARRAVGGYPAH